MSTSETARLLEFALLASREARDDDSDARWRAVMALHARPEPAVFEKCRVWCSSAIALERRLGADILGQLGYTDRAFPFRRESLPVLRSLLSDSDPDVISAALVAFSHLGADESLTDIAALARHDTPDVRHSVAVALFGHESDLAVETLIALSRDDSAQVRDWATFGLGAQVDMDTPEVRDALLARSEDEDADTRAEALAGLARRGDPRVLAPLRNALESGTVGTMDVEAARDLGSLELVAPLEMLRSWWDVDPELLEHAIAACRRKGR